MRVLVLLAVSASALGCHGGAAGVDLATPSGSADLAPSASDDMAAGDDMGAAAGADLALDGGAGVSGCGLHSGSASPTVLSGTTRAQMSQPLIAYDGTSTMVAWTVSSGQSGFDAMHTAWAELQNGAVVANGDLPGRTTATGQLVTFKGKFYYLDTDSYYQAPSLYAFDGANWNAVAGVVNQYARAIAVSGATMVGISSSSISGASNTVATLFDGTTVGTPTTLSSVPFQAIASDGAGGFGVLGVDYSSSGVAILHFSSYDGTSWSGDEVPAGVSWNPPFNVAVGGSAGTWCVAYSIGNFTGGGSQPVAYIRSGTTWTSTTLSNMTSAYGLMLAGNNGTLALGGDSAAAIYSGGTWTQTTLTGGGHALALAPFGSGYALLYGGGGSSLSAAIYGSSWGTPATISPIDVPTNGPTLALSVAGASMAVAFAHGSAQVASYSGGAWSAPSVVSTSSSPSPGVLMEGSNFVTAYAEPGTMTARTDTSGTLSSPIALPAPGSSGMVQDVSLARTADGRALAVWSQWDVAQSLLFAATYDCNGWSQPIALGAGAKPQVAANAGTFAVTFMQGTTRELATFTGSGLSTATPLGTATLRMASDGTHFVAVWDDSSGLWSSTSSDGTSWTTAQKIESTTGWAVQLVTGGPAGVVEAAVNAGSSSILARVWQNGAWSAPAMFYTNTVYACSAAVGAANALVACTNPAIHASLFGGGSWTDVTPTGTPTSLQSYVVASDGTDYRLVMLDNAATLSSAVLHAGAWSAVATESNLQARPPSISVAGVNGVWSLLFDDNRINADLTHANGSGLFAAASTFVPVQANVLATPTFVAWPGEADAWWTAPVATSKYVPVASVALGL